MDNNAIQSQSNINSAITAGALYTAIVFAIGFLLGTFRVLVLLPLLGATTAVLLEGPVILFASWVVCRELIRRLSVAPRTSSRLCMGAIAFGLLLIAELLLSSVLFERTLVEHFAHYQHTAGIIGLSGQILFSLFPLIQCLLDEPHVTDRDTRSTACRS